MLNCSRQSGFLADTLLAVVVILVLQGCVTAGQRPLRGEADATALTTGMRGQNCCVMANALPRQEAVARTAVRLLGRSRVEVGGRRYPADCSGLVRGVYATQRVDLYGELGELDGGNGVGRIYSHVVQHGRIHYGPAVHPGDLVFFHNTWDFNHDGLPNDPLTHVGIVEQVEQDGTVTFVSWVSTGIKRYRMNLQRPHIHKTAKGRILNDYMRRKGRGDPKNMKYLTGQLFAAFGTVVR